MKVRTFFSFSMITIATLSLGGVQSFAASHVIRETAVEIDGTKFWLPSSITVHKGDTVRIPLISKVPGPNPEHGFAIPAFNIKVVVDGKGIIDPNAKDGKRKTEVEFVADKAGIFEINCHLHPAHIGGQLIVLEKS